MALFRPALVILLVLCGSTADAGPQAVPRKYQAAFTWRAARIFLLGEAISSVDAVSEPLRFSVKWARTINRFVYPRPLATLSRCASSLLTLNLYLNE